MMFALRENALIVPARSFASLMELYENNYIYVRRLVPQIDALEPQEVSQVASAVDLHLGVLDRARYTTTLSLTHCFDEGERRSPDLLVRVYHDARTAEAMPSAGLERFDLWGDESTPAAGSLRWRWEVNRFLNRWLRYCLGEGHHFAGSAPPTHRGT